MAPFAVISDKMRPFFFPFFEMVSIIECEDSSIVIVCVQFFKRMT